MNDFYIKSEKQVFSNSIKNRFFIIQKAGLSDNLKSFKNIDDDFNDIKTFILKVAKVGAFCIFLSSTGKAKVDKLGYEVETSEFFFPRYNRLVKIPHFFVTEIDPVLASIKQKEAK